MKKLLAMMTGILLTGLSARAAEFYVAPDGKDGNPGTKEKPFATVEAARDAVRKINAKMTEDIVVVLRGGTYPLRQTILFEPADSGTGGHDVIYRAATNETPVLSGARAIVGWQLDTAGRWKAPSTVADFRQLYVGGRRAVRAKGNPPAGMQVTDGGYTTPTDITGWRNPGDVEFCYFQGADWTVVRCKVQRIERQNSQTVITMLLPQFALARNKAGIFIVNPAYVENAFELLDQPGEWYLDRAAKEVYYKPLPGEELAKVEVTAPAVEKLLELRGTLHQPVHNIRFEGLTFADSSWLEPNRIGHIDVQANFRLDETAELLDFRKVGYGEKDAHKRCLVAEKDRMLPEVLNGTRSIHGSGFRCNGNENKKSPSSIVCHAARGVQFHRCTFTRLGSGGLDLEYGAQNNVVAGCRFFDLSGTAIQVGDILKDDHHPEDPELIVKNNRILNNYIHDVCVEYKGGVGIFVGYTEGTVIAHNEICRLPYSGISIGWGWGWNDVGNFYGFTTPTPARNNRIEYNYVHQVMQEMRDGNAIYTLGSQPGSSIRYNHIPRGWLYFDMGTAGFESVGNCPLPRPADGALGVLGNAFMATPLNRVEVPHAPDLDPETLTLEAWIKPNNLDRGDGYGRWIVNKNGDQTTEFNFSLVMCGKRPIAYILGGNAAEGPELLTLNQWHHLAMSYDNSVLRLYADGKEVASRKIDKKRPSGNGPLLIGRRQHNIDLPFVGLIDEVRLYNRALTADELKSHYEALTATPPRRPAEGKGLVREWNFDDPEDPVNLWQKAGLEPAYRDLLGGDGAKETGKK